MGIVSKFMSRYIRKGGINPAPENFRRPAPPPAFKPGPPSRFATQCFYEDQGHAAGLKGKTRADCPYDREREPEAWNFWVYGCERATAQPLLDASGSPIWCSTANNDWPKEVYVRDRKTGDLIRVIPRSE